MKDPLRLRDDPAFLRETGCDLSLEETALEPPDLPALRRRVVYAAERPRRLRGVAGGTVVLVLIASLTAHLGRPTPEADPVVGDPVATAPLPARPGQPAAAVAPAASAVVDAPVAHPVPARAPIARAVPPPPPAPSLLVAVEAPALPAVSTEVAPTPPPADVASSDLAAQHAAFLAGEDARAAGAGTDARHLYEAYLQRWPAGAFAPESRLALLRLSITRGDTAETLALSGSIADDPALASHRAEVLRVRAETLASTGRCAEASQLTDQLPATTRAAIRKVCR